MTSPADWLRLLGSGVRAPAAGARALPAPIDPTSPTFALTLDKALDQARTGEFASGIEVTVADGVGIELSSDQVARLSAAADHAQAQGAARAIVLIDGLALRLDVAVRQVTGVADLSTPGVIGGVDSIIVAGHAPRDARAGAPLPPPGRSIVPTLMRIFETKASSPAAPASAPAAIRAEPGEAGVRRAV